MTLGSDNKFPKVILVEGAAPSTPAAGTHKVYVKTDGLLYIMDDTGTETLVGTGATGSGGGNPGMAMLDWPDDPDAFLAGPPGTPGSPGAAGATGAQGPTGPAVYLAAEQGDEGDPGPPGPSGPQGNPGSAGSTGAQGPTGPAVFMLGDEGPDGEPGPPGPAGATGATGATGSTGSAGADGAAGAAGPPGLDGEPGEPGAPGPPGPVGPTGATGAAGSAGAAGAAGPMGPPGMDGEGEADGGMMFPPGQPSSLGRHSLWVPAAAMYARSTNGAAAGIAEMSTNKDIVMSWDFDASTIEYVQFAVAFPKSWNEGTITFQPFWSHAATATNFGVSFKLQAVAVGDSDAQDVAFGTAQSSLDTGGTTDDMFVGPESSAITVSGTPTAGDVVLFQLYRDATDATNDTLAIDARLQGIMVYYTTDASNDA